jgi:gliding motility-associated-like protein
LIKSICLFFILLFNFSKIKAQVCTGTLGDPVINIDFGQGSDRFGPQLTETNYTYFAGSPNDGLYTLVKTSAGLNGGWHQNVVNRTPNSPNGYFMLVNASNAKGVFYQKTITGLCPNTTYEFAAWVINILRVTGIKPNIKFTIENDATIIKEFTTGDILEGSETNWVKYGTVFSTPTNVGTITLTMSNENPGGGGNDLGLDDITFRPCGPTINSTINNTSALANMCVGSNASFNFAASLSAGYNDPVYQWQKLENGIWTNLTGETQLQTSISFTNAALGQYQYRLVAAERPNILSANCRIAGNPLIINVNIPTALVATNSGVACVGTNVQLNVNEGVSFSWTGPNGFSSTEKNPVLTNVSPNQAGIYTVVAQNSNGCSVSAQTIVSILPEIMASTNFSSADVCENTSILLSASGGTSYSWFPTTGLSDANISNPIASPTQSTIYTVTIRNGLCTTTRTINLNLLKNVSANAGADITIVAGQTIELKGTVSGDNAAYLWSPATFLDDPTKLNPIATPNTSIMYTLTAQSGCNTSSDNVWIKVYPKVEIPNTFSPNGDGINDFWNIPSISSFKNISLKVISKNGQVVYETKVYRPWDGRWNGADLPVGAYYYTLQINDWGQKFSGWLFLAR